MRKKDSVFRDRKLILEDAFKQVEVLAKENTNDKYYYDIELAKKYINFISLLKHTSGSAAGLTFQLLPFQVKFITEVFCVLHRDTGFRRYKTAILLAPRKSGKTEMIAAVILLYIFLDQEKGKEVYCIANEVQQAGIVFNASVSMLRQTGYFEQFVNIYKSTKSIETKSVHKDVVRVLSSNGATKDGLRMSLLISDESASYKDDNLYKVVQESGVSRDEPLTIMISTANYLLENFFVQKVEYSKKVKQGVIKDDTHYSMLFQADPDKWEDEEEWKKCSPALGYGVKLENLRDMFQQAKYSGTEEVAFKTKMLNIWCSSADTFISDAVWQQNMGDMPDDEYLKRLPAYGGLDLSSVSDLTSYVIIFIDKERDKIYVKCKTYLPSDNLKEKSRNDEVPYQNWVKDGYLTLTEGNVVDYDFLQKDIEESYQNYNIKQVLFDRWNSHSIVSRLLEKRVNMIAIGMGFASMSSPTKQLEKLALQRTFITNDPILRWCVSNMVVDTDPAGNIKPNKDKGKRKIDVAVALIMALGGYIPDMEQPSAYAERGLREL